jgi:hypothetical protein
VLDLVVEEEEASRAEEHLLAVEVEVVLVVAAASCLWQRHLSLIMGLERCLKRLEGLEEMEAMVQRQPLVQVPEEVEEERAEMGG